MTVLYEDKEVLAVEKPEGIPSEWIEGKASLPDLLMRYREEKGEKREIYPVHRLDQVTGGAIVYAKTKEAAATLSKSIAEGGLEKEYFAALTGIPGEGEGILEDFLYHDVRTNKVFAVKTSRKGAKEARLGYCLVARGEYEGERISLVRVKLMTGRTHQIRVQFASRKLPLIGDRRYGSRLKLPQSRVALWSYRIVFPHPTSGEAIEILSNPPQTEPWLRFTKES